MTTPESVAVISIVTPVMLSVRPVAVLTFQTFSVPVPFSAHVPDVPLIVRVFGSFPVKRPLVSPKVDASKVPQATVMFRAELTSIWSVSV